jgi:hypothetical protein
MVWDMLVPEDRLVFGIVSLNFLRLSLRGPALSELEGVAEKIKAVLAIIDRPRLGRAEDQWRTYCWPLPGRDNRLFSTWGLRNRRYCKARSQKTTKETLLISRCQRSRRRATPHSPKGKPRITKGGEGPHPFQLLPIAAILFGKWLAREAVIRVQESLAKV